MVKHETGTCALNEAAPEDGPAVFGIQLVDAEKDWFSAGNRTKVSGLGKRMNEKVSFQFGSIDWSYSFNKVALDRISIIMASVD